MKTVSLLLLAAILLSSCTENASNGERIGLITQFSNSGIIWKSWEGHLNMTQTGMNSSQPFDFSIDNDREEPSVVATIDSAARLGWKVKLVYHQTAGKNWFHNRGETYHFVTSVEVLDKNPVAHALGGYTGDSLRTHGRVIDTIYVIIDKSK